MLVLISGIKGVVSRQLDTGCHYFSARPAFPSSAFRSLPPLGQYQYMLFAKQRHMCMNSLSKVMSEWPGIETMSDIWIAIAPHIINESDNC